MEREITPEETAKLLKWTKRAKSRLRRALGEHKPPLTDSDIREILSKAFE